MSKPISLLITWYTTEISPIILAETMFTIMNADDVTLVKLNRLNFY